jgi:hypothetical protein
MAGASQILESKLVDQTISYNTEFINFADELCYSDTRDAVPVQSCSRGMVPMNADSVVLVWDLDKTLGFFEPLYKSWDRDQPVTIQFRPGIIDTLENLNKQGFTHRLLTLASLPAAQMVLGAAGIRDLFVAIEGIGNRGKGDVSGIGRAHNLTEKQWPHNMLFIGDHPFNDAPVDLRVVFHLEIHALSRPAKQLESLILQLRERGHGSIRRGFDAIEGGSKKWWPFWKRQSYHSNKPTLRQLPGIEPLALMNGPKICPIIAFERAPEEPQKPEDCTFVPDSEELH